MDKKNVVISGIIVGILLVFSIIFCLIELSTRQTVNIVDFRQTLPHPAADHPLVLSSNGYNTADDNFRIVDGELYIGLDYANRRYCNERLFFDDEASIVIYTTSTTVQNFALQRPIDLRDGSETGSVPTFIVRDSEITGTTDRAKYVFVSAKRLEELYGLHFNYDADTQILVLDEDMMRYVEVKKGVSDAYLKASAKSDSFLKSLLGKNESANVYEKLSAGTTLYCFGEEDGMYVVANADGVRGYVKKSWVGDVRYEPRQTYTFDTFEMPEDCKLGNRISVIWEYYSAHGSRSVSEIAAEYAGTSGALTVMAPTWLHVWRDSDGGDPYIQNSIDGDIIDWAHRNGCKVWVTLENVDNTFEDITEMQKTLFGNTENRQAIVKQLLEWYRQYGFDGINIDLEALDTELGADYVQFMRELSATLRPAGCMVTTDLGVPTSWTTYYRHDLMGELCDYVCLMAYDEHYASDTTAGSVASYPWVSEGVNNCLLEGIPAERLVLCMPLYTRIWYLDDDENAIPSMTRTLSMEDAWNEVCYDRNVNTTWDTTCRQYYAEWTSDGLRVRTWLEDTRSMQARIDLAVEKNLGGVALWNKGRDTNEIWDLMDNYLHE